MRIIQYRDQIGDRRVGVVQGENVLDLTSASPELNTVYDIFCAAQSQDAGFSSYLDELVASGGTTTCDYAELLSTKPVSGAAHLLPPFDHVDPHRLMVSGTGLTHLGSMQSRNQMHAGEESESGTSDAVEAEGASPDEPLTDSAKMFQMGISGGKPSPGQRGVSPEWFYKGNGSILRGHNHALEIPAHARDGGEEPELAACYIVDKHGAPNRIGFALGNEWSDHATERINYLYLAPSKLRTCSIGPELCTDFEFDAVSLECIVRRGGSVLYESGELFSGESAMCHSLANCEDHHFKYAAHRVPGDCHVHFFGTSKLSYSERDWHYQPGDEITINCPAAGAPLTNVVAAAEPESANPIVVRC